MHLLLLVRQPAARRQVEDLALAVADVSVAGVGLGGGGGGCSDGASSRLHRVRSSVARNDDRSVPCGGAPLNSGLLKLADRLLVRMAVVVPERAGDDGDLGADLPQEDRVRSVVRAVVRDLEDCRLREGPHALAFLPFGVAREQDGEASVGNPENDRVVVRIAVRSGERLHGRDDLNCRVSGFFRESGLRTSETDFLPRDRLEEPSLERGTVLVSAVPDLSDLEGSQDVLHSADVVGMRMRRDEDVDLPDAEIPEVARDRSPRVPLSGVDEHGGLVGELYEDRVSLPDVDRMHYEIGGEGGECGEEKGEEAEKECATATAVHDMAPFREIARGSRYVDERIIDDAGKSRCASSAG